MKRPRRTPARNSISFALFALFAVFTTACGPASVTPASPTLATIEQPSPTTAAIEPTPARATGAIASGVYRNLFQERGKTDAAIHAKLDAAWQQLFYGDEANQRVFFPAGADMAYIKYMLIFGVARPRLPDPGIVFAFGLDERTVADWHEKLGRHAQHL